jgi:HK97 family phage prohead protease
MNKYPEKDRLCFRTAIEIRGIESPGSVGTVGGLAVAVDTRSELLGDTFYETVARSAVTPDVISGNDIKLYVNHDPGRGTLARSKYGHGSLRLRVTERGLEFETDLPDTPLGKEIYEGIRRGDYDAMSFAFRADGESWEENEDGTYNRTINSIKELDEISILSIAPAYTATEVAMRSLDAFKNSNETDDMKKTTKRAKRDEEELKEDELEQKKKRDAESEDEEPKDEERTEDEEPKDDEERAEDEEPKDDEERAEGDEDEDDEDEERDCDEDEDGEPIEDRAMLKSYFKELRSQIA